MKTHAIVQGFVICSLLVWTAVWDLPSSDAGGPPIRLAVYQNDTPEVDELLVPEPPPLNPEERVYTQPIPTEIRENPIRLIPTDIDSEVVVTTSLDPAMAETGILITGNFPNANTVTENIFEEQKFYVLGMIPEPADLKSFLDIHIDSGPFRYVATELSNRPSMIATPWIVGEQSWELVSGFDTPDIPETSIVFRTQYQGHSSEFQLSKVPGGKFWWLLGLDCTRSQLESTPIVSVAKQRSGRFNTYEVNYIRHLIIQRTKDRSPGPYGTRLTCRFSEAFTVPSPIR